MTMIPVPPALRDYFVDDKIGRAIQIMATAPMAPANLVWKELPSLMEARLAVVATKTQYALFLYNLWNETWGRALEKAGLNCQGAPTEFFFKEPGAEEIWSNEEIMASVNVNEERAFNFRVGLGVTDGLYLMCPYLSFHIDGDDYSWSTNAVLGKGWKPYRDEDDDIRYTAPGAFSFEPAADTFDATTMQETASGVAELIRRG